MFNSRGLNIDVVTTHLKKECDVNRSLGLATCKSLQIAGVSSKRPINAEGFSGFKNRSAICTDLQ